MRINLTGIFLFLSLFVFSQNDSLPGDTLKRKTNTNIDLSEVEIVAEKDNTFGISRLNNVDGTNIYAGKKSEAVYLQDLDANLAANNSRQVFSK